MGNSVGDPRPSEAEKQAPFDRLVDNVQAEYAEKRKKAGDPSKN